MQVKSKVWLDERGMPIFGSGKCRILRAVAETGSLNKAATKLGMSYRHAWSTIRAAEQRLGEPLLHRQRGGQQGGGAQLTEYAEALTQRFEELDRDVCAYTNMRFEELWGRRSARGKKVNRRKKRS